MNRVLLGALFLVVLVLVSGRSVSSLAAAGAGSVLPVAAFSHPASRACRGAGVLARPLSLSGFGMGLALPLSPVSVGWSALLQDTALVALDRAACRFGTSREELALAFADPALAQEYEREHRVDPRSVSGMRDGLLGRS